MTLDDDEDDLSGALGMGAAGASIKPSAVGVAESAALPQTHVVMSTPAEASSATQTEEFRLDRHYVAMSDTLERGGPHAQVERTSDHIGPILLIVAPLASGTAGAMTMLSKVDDFSKGAWYAVGTVFVVMLLATIVGGMVLSGFLFLVRIRWTFLLRFVFVAVAAAVTYVGVTHLPKHVQVREDDLPAIIVRR